MEDILAEVKRVFDIELEELRKVEEVLDEDIVRVIRAVNDCKGKVVVCGMGKPGHIAGKISASMSSMGIPSYTLHPGEAMHGDLGTLSSRDIILFISNSGETMEICSILPNIRMIGAAIVAITSNRMSTLAQYADYLVCLPDMKEAGELQLAPTSSTTAALVVGDAIAVVVSKMRKFRKENFALFHPSGALGRRLTLRVCDIMHREEMLPLVSVNDSMNGAIVEMCRTGLGAVIVVDGERHMLGLITDGDLKRYMERKINVYQVGVREVMTLKPVYTHEGVLAVEALKQMEDRPKQLSVLPVLDSEDCVVGLIRNHDIIRLGIFL